MLVRIRHLVFLVGLVSVTSLPARLQPKDTKVVFSEGSPANDIRRIKPVIERGLLELCLNLERVSKGLERQENTVIAPLSIGGLVALLLAGAGGATRRELETLLGVESLPHKQNEVHQTLATLFAELEGTEQVGRHVSYGSGLFVQEGDPIKDSYLQLARNVYRSEIIPVNFKRASYNTTGLINRWVSTRTEGMIPSVLDSVVDPSTSMIIANVFYFKGSWKQPFVEKYTKMSKFHVTKKDVIPVSLMMGMKNASYAKVRGSHQILGLPYKGDDTSMFFILPESGDLKTFVAGLKPESIVQFVNMTTEQQVICALPKMRVEGTLELSGPLSALGVSSVFSPLKADLSGIGRGYHVSEMVHKVSIEVTESGTVAAAASVETVMRDGSAPLFRADRPFLFFMYHHPTGSILFWGTVFRPQPVAAARGAAQPQRPH